MKTLDNGKVQCRCRITGTYKGKTFVYTDPEGSDGSQFIDDSGDPSTYWWTEGNFACDCNRSEFLPDEFGHDGECGNSIVIKKIECVDYDGPVLFIEPLPGHT